MNAPEDKALVCLVVAISLAFAWVLWPFYGAILWGTVIAVVFAPLHRRLLRSVRQRNVAALATVVMILFLIILPLTLITASVVQQAYGVYESIKSGEINVSRYFDEVRDALPGMGIRSARPPRTQRPRGDAGEIICKYCQGRPVLRHSGYQYWRQRGGFDRQLISDDVLIVFLSARWE